MDRSVDEIDVQTNMACLVVLGASGGWSLELVRLSSIDFWIFSGYRIPDSQGLKRVHRPADP